MPSILDWSKSATANATSDSEINWQELQNPDTVNDSARKMMQRIAEWRDDLSAAGRPATGSGGAYVIASASSPDSLVDGLIVWFIPNHENAGPATLKINSLPLKPLRGRANTPLRGGEILPGCPVGAVYSSENDEFLLLNSGHAAVAIGPKIAGAYNSGVRVGDIMITADVVPKAGRIRLGEAVQVIDPVAYPELADWIAEQGSPWGTNTIPSAAGYFLRFAATTSDIDPSGARAAGSKQAQAFLEHDHTSGTLDTDSESDHRHTTAFTYQSAGVGGGGTQVDFLRRLTSGGAGIGNVSFQTATTTAHDHEVNAGRTSPAGGEETRPVNVALHADIIASTSEANVDVYAVNGQAYKFDDGTADANPGSGRLAFNNADLSIATRLYISQSGRFGQDLSDWLATWDDSTSQVRGYVTIYKVGAPANAAIYQITGTLTDNTTYDTFNVTHVTSSGTFVDGDELGVMFDRTGQKGEAGPSGGGLSYLWDSSTTDSDPGSGNIRSNNATLASASEFYVSTTDSSSADVTAYLDSIDDSTSTVKGSLQVTETATPSNFAIYTVTSVTTATNYRKLGVNFSSGNGSFDVSDGISITFSRTGDKGETGSTGADGTDPGLLYTFSTTTTDADPGAGYLRANNASLSSATELYINDVDRNSNNHETGILSWDDAINATSRGKVLISTPSDGAMAVFDITGSSTDASGYVKLSVSYSSGATSFANDAQISVQFAQAGNDGSSGGGSGDLLSTNNLSDVASAATAFSNIKQAASETATGVVELATTAEAATGTDTARAVTAAGVKAYVDGQADTVPFAKRARASQTAATAVSNATVTVIDMDTEVYDTAAFWAASPDPEKMTVPSGVSFVQLFAYLQFTAALGSSNYLQIEHFNSSNVSQGTYTNVIISSFGGLITPPVSVASGDYFHLKVFHNAGASRSLFTDGRNYLAMAALVN